MDVELHLLLKKILYELQKICSELSEYQRGFSQVVKGLMAKIALFGKIWALLAPMLSFSSNFL